eukprot:gnl/MRDRNA2_/MRDRNA2_85198_c0_seq1.p1 gnl/MRDRNA2_/MRDRNA2_85198_c0~~gnl/MRDRNA2_/MRDRNA2_85198_c0_seq1.p1  ORF type:complete len:633 (-),score=77.59 gnl/MRDRNA2_/MRDRNA2_85198_c0_seq1:85-1722(-)
MVSPWYGAKLAGMDPFACWPALDPCQHDTFVLLCLTLTISLVGTVFALRACFAFFVILLAVVTYIACCFFLGSPHERHDVQSVMILSSFAGIAWKGKRNAERQERLHFFNNRHLFRGVSALQGDVKVLKTRISAMRALMDTICEVVFFADSNLRVVGQYPRLNDLLGSSSNCCFMEMLVNVPEVQNRFTSIVSPLLAPTPVETSSENTPAVVLVPPCTFQDRESGRKFDAEVLVVDTGNWANDDGEGAWRYLVGLKNLSHHEFQNAEDRPEIEALASTEPLPDFAFVDPDLGDMDGSRQACEESRNALVPETGTLPEEDSELPESFYLSSDPSARYMAHRSPVLHVNVRIAQEVQTDLSWTENHGFKCQRCSKPPISPDDQDRVSATRQRFRELQEGKQKKSVAESDRTGSRTFDPNFLGPPQLSGFQSTSVQAKRLLIDDVLLKWNCQRPGPMNCCPFHVAVSDGLRILRELRGKGCNPMWAPWSGSQCESCGTMYDDEVDQDESFCEICSGKMCSASQVPPRTPPDSSDAGSCTQFIPSTIHL